MENREFSRIEMILESEVELTGARFHQLQRKSKDDAERVQAQDRVVHALDRLSAFILHDTIPDELRI